MFRKSIRVVTFCGLFRKPSVVPANSALIECHDCLLPDFTFLEANLKGNLVPLPVRKAPAVSVNLANMFRGPESALARKPCAWSWDRNSSKDSTFHKQFVRSRTSSLSGIALHFLGGRSLIHKASRATIWSPDACRQDSISTTTIFLQLLRKYPPNNCGTSSHGLSYSFSMALSQPSRSSPLPFTHFPHYITDFRFP